MRILEKIIQSNLPPTRQDVVWIDTSDVQNPVVKLYVNGEWKLASSESADVQHLQEEINEIIEELAGEGGSIEDLGEIRTKALAAIAGNGITNVTSLTKDEYDALEEKDPETIYLVKDDPTRGHPYQIITMGSNEYLAIADRNIGAESVTDGGYYFQWAGTVGHNKDEEYSYNLNTSPYYDTDPEVDNYIKYTDVDGKTHLELMDDAAHVLWGGKWTTINYDDLDILMNDYGFYFDTLDGVPGICLDAGVSQLFFPRSIVKGDDIQSDYTYSGIWINSIINDDFNSAWNLSFCIEGDNEEWYLDDLAIEDITRYHGCNIRPVIKVNDLSELEPTYEIYIGGIKASSSAEPQPQQGGMTVIRHMIGDSNITANPNEFHIIPSCNSLTLSLNDSSNPDTINYYIVMFTFGGTNSNPNLMQLSVPDTVKWANGIIPDITCGTYQLSILEGCATLTKFELV